VINIYYFLPTARPSQVDRRILSYSLFISYWLIFTECLESAQFSLLLVWTKFCSAFLGFEVIDDSECLKSGDHAVRRPGNDSLCAPGFLKSRRSTCPKQGWTGNREITSSRLGTSLFDGTTSRGGAAGLRRAPRQAAASARPAHSD
jgi:hypothetical protein